MKLPLFGRGLTSMCVYCTARPCQLQFAKPRPCHLQFAKPSPDVKQYTAGHPTPRHLPQRPHEFALAVSSSCNHCIFSVRCDNNRHCMRLASFRPFPSWHRALEPACSQSYKKKHGPPAWLRLQLYMKELKTGGKAAHTLAPTESCRLRPPRHMKGRQEVACSEVLKTLTGQHRMLLTPTKQASKLHLSMAPAGLTVADV